MTEPRVELALGESFVDVADWADRYVHHVLTAEGLMTKRSLPRLESTRYRDDRPGPADLIPLPAGPPSEVVAFNVLVRFIAEDEARSLQKEFARLFIEPRRLTRLGDPITFSGTEDTTVAERITDWLEAWWLAAQDGAMGIPRPERWKKGKSL